jgi:hypothetical protein
MPLFFQLGNIFVNSVLLIIFLNKIIKQTNMTIIKTAIGILALGLLGACSNPSEKSNESINVKSDGNEVKVGEEGVSVKSNDENNVNITTNGVDVKSSEGDDVTIGKDGIKVKSADGDDVSIGENGISVKSAKGNDDVKIDKNGVTVKAKDTVNVKSGNVKVKAGGVNVDVSTGGVKIKL